MLKLMKYEFQKQMFSKVIIAILLGVLVAYFALMNIMDKEQNAGVALVVMFFVMVVAAFYVSVESISVYGKDLKTKQSYMLFLVPQSSYEILGAKMIAAILQIFFTMAIYAVAIGLCSAIYLMKYSSMKEILEVLKKFFEISFDVQIDYMLAIRVLFTIFILWVFVVMLGIFVETLVNTVLTKSKVISFLVAVAYVLLFWGVMELENTLYDVMLAAKLAEVVRDTLDILYFVLIDIVLYTVSAWLIDKKLSV